MDILKNMRILETYMIEQHGEIMAEELHKLHCDIAKENITMTPMKKFPSIGEVMLAARRIKNFLTENELNEYLEKFDVFITIVTIDYENNYYEVRSKVKLSYMPYDRDFGRGLIHATGFRVLLGDDLWWYEYYDPEIKEYFYG